MSDKATPSSPATDATPTLARALDQSEQVKVKVEECVVDLASVNVVLKQEVKSGVPLRSVEEALERSEQVENKVQECVAELEQVNDSLAEEIDERRLLEAQLENSTSELRASRVRERRSRHDSHHDKLTGLPNMTLFVDRLESAIVQAARHEWRVAVLFLDLDRFKSVNDTHGHDIGDRVLEMIGLRLQQFTRAGDTVARRSGDEFLVVMLEAKDEATVGGFARQLLDVVAKPCQIGELDISVIPSIGVAIYPDDGLTANDLLRSADKAMYASKKQREGAVMYGRMREAGA